MGGHLFEKDLIIVEESRLVIIDIHTGADMHGIDETQAFLDAAFFEGCIDLKSDIDEGQAFGNLKKKFFSIGFHISPSLHNDLSENNFS